LNVKTSEFDYYLPPELIAQTPIEPRDASRLMVIDRRQGTIAHRHFSELGQYLREGDLLVGNNSRVIPARLHGHKVASGGEVELLLLHPSGAGAWECLVGGKGLRVGSRIAIDGHDAGAIVATVVGPTEAGGRIVSFEPPVQEWLWKVGEMPLPPYIHETLADPERYQTVYSRIEGSAASSTAGLHFTPDMLVELREKGIHTEFVTLHIGLDTFRPMKEDNIEDHQIHREWAQMSRHTAEAINRTRLAGGRIVAIGTTSVRTLESAAQLALGATQAEPAESCGPACAWQSVAAFEGETGLYITPGFSFRAVDVMVTNFHLPRSTLLLLVSAFAGKELMEQAYAEAIRERYRFFSFGDAMLIL
jgi:S-adenosylmethionine:tRNA ribosyltransferase-isomerase